MSTCYGLKPFGRGIARRHATQPQVGPKLARNVIQNRRIDRAPTPLQPVRAEPNPIVPVHAEYCTFIQYCPQVLAIVYRCKWEGQRLDRETIQGDPKRGDLVVRKRGFYHRIALLLAPDGETYVLPVLDKVRLLAINDRGVLLSGIEVHPPRGLKGNGPMYEQVWWCVTKDVPEPCADEGRVGRACGA